MACRLDQKDVVATHGLGDLHVELAVSEAGDLHLRELHAHLTRDALAELRVGTPGEQHEVAVRSVGHARTLPRRAAHPSMIRWRARPTASAPGGTSASTNDPAPM